MKLKQSLRLWLRRHPKFHPIPMIKPGIFRVITGPIRVLPDFIIIGAFKCGTTSLYNYLIEHPSIYSSTNKELNYFVRKGTRWYRPNFPTVLLKYYVTRILKKSFVTGESSPYYLLNPLVPKAVKKKIPNIKLIVLLRNPIDRTYSQYNQVLHDKLEPYTFEDAIKNEKIKTIEEWENFIEDGANGNRDHARYSYLASSLYYDQLKIWMSYFSKEQFLIIKSEEFFNDPEKILKDVFKFLGVQNYKSNTAKKHNVGSYESKIEGHIQKYLKEFFQPYNEKLYEFLGKNFKWD